MKGVVYRVSVAFLSVSGASLRGEKREGTHVKVKKIGLVLILALIGLALFRGTRVGETPPTVTGGDPVTYRCDNGDRVVARYYGLSDGSLNFVRLSFPDEEYTLPQLLSASGARYSDEARLVWWVKGEEARVESRDEEGEWRDWGSCRVEP